MLICPRSCGTKTAQEPDCMSMAQSLAHILVVFALAWSPSIFSQTVSISRVGALPVADVLRVRSLAPYSPPSLSPDGTLLAYTVIESQETRHFEIEAWARTGVPWYGAGAQIFILNVKTGTTKNLTGGVSNNWQPTWSPDGSFLAFLSDRDRSGQAGLWIWNLAKDTIRKISDAKVRTDEIKWSSDSAKIIVKTVPVGLSVEDYVAQVSRARADVNSIANIGAGATVNVYEVSVASSTGTGAALSDPWNLNQMLQDLTLIDVPSGNAETLVHGVRIAAYQPSPDGTKIAYTIPKQFEKPGSQQILYELVTVTLATKKQQVIASDVRFDYNGDTFSWSPDALHLGFCSNTPDETSYGCHVTIVKEQLSSETLRPVQAGTCTVHKVSRPLWSEDGEDVYFVCDGALWQAGLHQGVLEKSRLVARIANREITQIISHHSNLLWTLDEGKTTIVMTRDREEHRDGFYRVNLATGQSAKLMEVAQCYFCVSQREQVDVSCDGTRAIYVSEDSQHPADLWMVRGASLATQRLTDLNPQFNKHLMGKVRLVHWLSDDGEPLHGALLLPSDYREGNRYPLLVYVYAGSRLSNNLNRFGLGYVGPFNMQLFATRGYAVLLPDSPQRLGTPMLDMAKNVLPGVNKVIEMGIADGSRLGVMGHSNGGYGALALIVQTPRFKAAVAVDGTGDLLSHYGQMNKDGTAYGTSNVEKGQNGLGGTPWEVRDRFVENSPFFYLDRIETPLLLIHGSDDAAVAPFLADQIFVGLRRLGKEVKYAKYDGEGHSPSYWSYANQADFCQRMIAWFGLHLGSDGKP
jgi:dipeptidyl aminopeptidase/acylaminoacyl peptidase